MRWMVGAALAAGVVSATVPAQAEYQCDAVVMDGAGVLGGREREIESAAQDLTRLGATVRVWTFSTFGSMGSLDHLEADVERRCGSWRAADGGTRNSLIAMLIAVEDREVGVYSGAQWRHVVAPAWATIQDRSMKPRFRDGDFAGGFIAGLQDITRRVQAAEQAVSAPAQAAAPAVAPVVITAAPTDLSGCADVGFGVLALLFLAGIVWGGIAFSRKREQRKAAQAAAQGKKKAAAARINELNGEQQTAGIQIRAAAKIVAADDTRTLLGQLEAFENQLGHASARYGDLGNSASNPDRDGRTAEEYRQAEKGYADVLGLLDKANTALDSAERMAQEAQRAAQEAPAALAAAKSAVERAAGVLNAMREKLWKVDPAEATLQTSRQLLETAEQHLAAKKAAAAKKVADDAARAATDAATIADGLPKRKQTCDAGCAEIVQRIATVTEAIAKGGEAFERISSAYAESSWEAITGNGSRAEELVGDAQDCLDTAQRNATMEEQHWDSANSNIADAGAALKQADTLVAAIHALEEQLAVAKREAPNEIMAAQADLERAQAYEQQHDADISDDMKREIHEAAATLQQARAELALPTPDYLEVVRLAQETNNHADKILADSRSQHEAAERLRQKATSALRDAEHAVSQAEHYISSHGSEVESSARSLLSSAASHLASARHANGHPKECIRYAEAATSDANEAYRRAKRNVDDAEEERRRRRRAAEEAAAAARRASQRSRSSYGGSSSFGSSSRSGGSSSFGSSSRSGGSSKW